MDDKFQYRLSEKQKIEIAQNLIDFLQKKETEIKAQTRLFVINWCLTGPSEKRKAFFDVWEIVLKNYLPDTPIVLFRTCERIGNDGKIASFTGRFESARKFSNGKDFLIICDTKDVLSDNENFNELGQYKHTFYPLVSVLKKAKASGGCGFKEGFLDEYIGEDEYIMRVDLGNVYCFEWETMIS